MYRIAILSDNQNLGRQIFDWTKCFSTNRGLFPVIEVYKSSEQFYSIAKKAAPNVVIVALSGVAGLNASERLRSLCPECGLIWCSDLDFSLQAYRLRAKYFIKAPPTKEELCEGLSLLLKQRVMNPKYKIQKKINL